MAERAKPRLWQRIKDYKRHRLLTALALTALAVCGSVAVAQAQSFRGGDNTTVAAGQTIDSSLYIAGNTVDVAGTVNGDVFCAGENVTISGTVNGDILCAGQTVRIAGTVNGDVRAAGQNLTVDAAIKGSATLAGQTVTASAQSKIGRDVTIAGQEIALNGAVGRDVVAGSNAGVLNGLIGRNVSAGVEQLRLGSDASVKGDITYSSRNQLQRDGGAEVAGTVTQHQPQNKRGGTPWMLSVWWLVAMLIFALLVAVLMPQTLHRANRVGRQRPWLTALVGLLASILGPVVVVGLLVSVFGVIAGVVALLVWLVLLMLSGPFAAYAFGHVVVEKLKSNDNIIWTMLAGTAILLLVYMIPFVGFGAMLLALWYGLGMLVRYIAGKRDFRYRIDDSDDKPHDKPKARLADADA